MPKKMPHETPREKGNQKHSGRPGERSANVSEELKRITGELENTDPYAREKAKADLIHLRGPEVAQELIRALNHPNPEVRIEIVRKLGVMEDPQTVNALARILEEDSDVRVRAAAIGTLGNIGGPEAVSALEKAQNDSNRQIREEAGWTLGQAKRKQ